MYNREYNKRDARKKKIKPKLNMKKYVKSWLF